jgi:hypothetical protein
MARTKGRKGGKKARRAVAEEDEGGAIVPSVGGEGPPGDGTVDGIPAHLIDDVRREAMRKRQRKAREAQAKARRVKGGRFASAGAFFLFVVMVLGILNGMMVMYEGMQVQGPDEILSEKNGNIYGRVTDIDGVPLDQAKVTVIGTSYETMTTPDGWYFIEDVPVKDYQVQADKGNYTSMVKTVKVEENMPRPVNFQLEPGTGSKGHDSTLPLDMDRLKPSYAVSVIIIIVASVFAGIGALLAFRRKMFRTVILSAAIGILSYGFVAGMLMSMVALVMLVMARPAFVKVPPVAVKAPRPGRAKARRETTFEELEEDEGPETVLDKGEVEDAEAVKVLGSRKAEVELEAEGGDAIRRPDEEPIPEAEIREDLVSKAQEAEGTVEDTEADIKGEPGAVAKKRKKEVKTVGPEVVKDMEGALKETLESPDETETDIVKSVLDKLGIDSKAAEEPVLPVKKKPKKKKKLSAHQETQLCRVCVKPIIIATDAKRCRCGRVYHIHCAKEVGSCKNCGCKID